MDEHSKKTKTMCRMLINFCELNARIVRLENLFVAQALSCQTVGADLAHPHAVTPAAADENKAGYAPFFIILLVDYKKLFAQSERGSNTATTHVRDPFSSDDLEIRRSSRSTACHHAKIDKRSNSLSHA